MRQQRTQRIERAGLLANGAVSIGDDLGLQLVGVAEVSRKAETFFQKRGKKVVTAKLFNKYKLLLKIERGELTGEVAANVSRDPANAAAFAELRQILARGLQIMAPH